MDIMRTCRKGENCTCIIGQFEELGIMNALKCLNAMDVTDLRMQCGDYQARIGFLMNGQDKKQRDLCLSAHEIEKDPKVFPEVLLFPESFPDVVDSKFSMRS